MEDKTFDLLTQMYSEFKDFRKETDNRFTKLEIVIENEIKPDIKASLEGYNLVFEKLQEQDKKLDSIEKKLERQELELTVIKGGKKVIK